MDSNNVIETELLNDASIPLDAGKIIEKEADHVRIKPLLTVELDEDGMPVLRWERIEGAAAYQVWASDSEDGEYIRHIRTEEREFRHTSGASFKMYYYKVNAVFEDESVSDFSDLAAAASQPTKPFITINIDRVTGKPVLKWNETIGAEKYELYRSTKPAEDTFTNMVFTTDGYHYTDNDAVPGRTYYYRLRAIGEELDILGEIKLIVCDCEMPIIKVRRNLKGQPVVTWKPIKGASRYEVFRSDEENGPMLKMFTTTETHYCNVTAVSGKTYYYAVKAICELTRFGNSAFSEMKSVKAR